MAKKAKYENSVQKFIALYPHKSVQEYMDEGWNDQDYTFTTLKRHFAYERKRMGVSTKNSRTTVISNKMRKVNYSKAIQTRNHAPVIGDTEVVNDSELFAEFPDGEYKLRNPYQIKGDKRIGVINDIHIGSHVREAVMMALRSLKEDEIDTLILNGDIMDSTACGRHGGIKASRTLLETEVHMARVFLRDLRRMFGDIQIVYHFGNHEHWVERFIINSAKPLEGLFQLEKLLHLDDFGIVYVPQDSGIEAGNLDIIHGHQIKGGGEAIAMAKFKRAKTSIMFGHHHTKDVYTATNFRGKMSGSWAVPCLCDLSPSYSLYNPRHSHGFGRVNLSEDDSFEAYVRSIDVQNKKIY